MKKIYFFNGWGMDESILNEVSNSTDYTIELVNFPYNLSIEKLIKDKEIIFIGWSFGVYYLNKFLNQENNKIRYKSALALNGVPEIIGKYGINKKMFDLTLSTLNISNLQKFYTNMGMSGEFKGIKKNFESIRYELKSFKENYEIFPNKIDYFLIGKYDRIIPRINQEKFCLEKNIKYNIVESTHYIFSYFKDFKDILTYIEKEE